MTLLHRIDSAEGDKQCIQQKSTHTAMSQSEKRVYRRLFVAAVTSRLNNGFYATCLSLLLTVSSCRGRRVTILRVGRRTSGGGEGQVVESGVGNHLYIHAYITSTMTDFVRDISLLNMMCITLVYRSGGRSARGGEGGRRRLIRHHHYRFSTSNCTHNSSTGLV